MKSFHSKPQPPKQKQNFDPSLGRSGATWANIIIEDGKIVSDVPPPPLETRQPKIQVQTQEEEEDQSSRYWIIASKISHIVSSSICMALFQRATMIVIDYAWNNDDIQN